MKGLDYRLVSVGGKYAEQFGRETKVSLEDYELVSKMKLYWTSEGYVRTSENVLSRFLMQPRNNLKVDHINGDKGDNRRPNLLITDSLGNGQNKKKRKHASSIYHGVIFRKSRGKFEANTCGKFLGKFESEIEAAIVHDRWVIENNTRHKLNFPEKREEYLNMPPLEKKKQKTNRTGFKGVKANKKKFVASYCSIHLGSFNTAEEAASAYDNYVIKNNLYHIKLNFPAKHPDFINVHPIKTEMFEVDGTEAFENIDLELDCKVIVANNVVLIEKADYENFVKYESLSLLRKNYIQIIRKGLLHRIIMGESNPENLVDHKNGNPFDVRRRMLRVTDFSGNARNRKKSKGCSSQYIGVSLTKGYWHAYVKGQYIERRKIEEEAARVRDLYILKNYPNDEMWKFNFIWTEQDKEEWKIRLSSKFL